MKPFKIGAMTGSFRLGHEGGIRKAAELGADGVQITTSGEMDPAQLDAGGRARIKALCADLGLEISALCAAVAGHYRDAETSAGTVAATRQVIDLAADLGSPVVTTHIGVVPEDREGAKYATLLQAMKDVGTHCVAAGVRFAIETGPEPATTLKKFLDEVGSPGMGVNLDPANLVMVVADDPVQAVHTLGDYIVHTHAKDGVQDRPCDAEQVYHGTTPPELGPGFRELPLGKGDVNWDAYLNALEEIGFKGFLTIEREVGDDPIADIQEAIAFLRRKLA